MTVDMLYIYIIIATASSLTAAITATYYWARLRLEHMRSTKTQDYYARRLVIEQKRADDSEKYYKERERTEAEKIEVERAKLAAELEKVLIEKKKLELRQNGAP